MVTRYMTRRRPRSSRRRPCVGYAACPVEPTAADLVFGRGDWQRTASLGNYGRLDTIVDVEGHPRFDGVRYYFFPGGGGELMEWVKDGEHYGNEEAPIPEDVRRRVLEVVVDDLAARLKCHEW